MEDGCKYWASKTPKTYQILERNHDARDRSCRIDYLSKPFQSSMESSVDCEQRCEGYQDEDDPEEEERYKTCVEDCHDMIKEYAKGSIVYRETGEVIDANMPMTITPFMTEDKSMSEYRLDEHWEKQVLDKFDAIGCDPDPEVGFRHPHEFAATTAGSEPEEDPEAFAVHIRGSKDKCYLDDVYDLLKKLGET